MPLGRTARIDSRRIGGALVALTLGLVASISVVPGAAVAEEWGPSVSPTADRTLLLVRARADRFPLPAERPVPLVTRLRTDGAITGVRTWCELRGVRLPRAAQHRLCHFRVEGPTRTRAPDRVVVEPLRIRGKVACSSPRLQVWVRIAADRPDADRAVFHRVWSVEPGPGGSCRLHGTG